MDRTSNDTGKDSSANSDGHQETSFIAEGLDSCTSVDTADSLRTSHADPILEHRIEATSRDKAGVTSRDDDSSDLPPSYLEAVGGVEPLAEQTDVAGGEENGLTSEEIAVIMRSRESLNKLPDDAATEDAARSQRQRDRSSYLPSDSRGSYEEAVEMLPAEDRTSNLVDSHEEAETVDAPPRRLSILDVEEGHQSDKDNYECVSLGPLNRPMTSLCRFLRRQSASRILLFSLLIMVIIGLMLFVSLFPASFVYVNYHQIALKQNKVTNVVDRDTVYHTGCYVLGPSAKLILFTASVHNVIDEISVFTLDTITVDIRYSAHYFIRPQEVGQLYSMFLQDYDPVFRKIIRSSMRNLAGSTLTVDNFRFNRTYVETQMHAMLRKKLGGDCCPECCRERICQSNAYCSLCKQASCDQGFHIDMRYFHLLSVSIPNEIFERLLYRTILEVQKEKEFHLQDHALIQKETERLTQRIKNQATEVIQRGQNEADKIGTIAQADREKVVQQSFVTATKGLFSRLNVTQQDHKLSLMLVRALEDCGSLYAGYGFNESILFAH